MFKFGRAIDRYLWYSVRRRLLDRDLAAVCHQMCGRVLEAGNGRNGRRGRFKPPYEFTEQWLYIDLEKKRRPHIQSDLQRLSVKSEMFDTVLCLEVLEYTTFPDEALQEIRRVLKPAGRLILSTPFLHRADSINDRWRFSEHGLRELFARAGFDVIYLKSQGGALAVAANILKYAIYIISNKWLKAMLFIVFAPVLMVLFKIDKPTRIRLPLLATFSTGYLTIGRPKK